MSIAIPAGAQLTWATAWMLDRRDSPSGGAYQLRIWRAEPGAGTPLLWAHDGSVLWAYFGGQNPTATEADALSDSWIRNFLIDPALADRLSGVFALVAVDLITGRIAVASDRLGVQGIYYTQQDGTISHVATHLMWLLLATQHDGAVDDEACVSHFAYGYTVAGTQTVYRNVNRLPAASWLIAGSGAPQVREYWHYTDGAAAPRVGELNEMLRRAMAPWPGPALFLPLTAGKDSLCLAALLPEHAPVHTGTFGLAESADRLQGRALAAALQAPYAGVDVCEAAALDKWIGHVAFHSAGLATASYVDMARFVDRAVPDGTPVVLGEGGECVRDFFSGPDGSATALSRDYMTAAPLLRTSLNARLSGLLVDYPAAMLDRARESAAQPDEASFALHFYRAIRMPGNFSLRHAVLAPLRPKLSPFLDRDFVAAAYGLPQKWFAGSLLHRVMLEAARPEWLEFFDHPLRATATTQGWRERLGGETGRTLADSLGNNLQSCDDVFDVGGVTELLRNTSALADKAIYHLLRIASFAAARRLLRSEAAAHAAGIASRSQLILAQVDAAAPAGSARPGGTLDLVRH